MANNIMCVATVPHTGTRSIMTSMGTIKKRMSPKMVSHSTNKHSYLFLHNIDDWRSKLKQSRINILFGHITPWNMPAIKEISECTKIITSCRDPLLSLITSIRANKRPLPYHDSYEQYKHLPTRTAHLLVSWKLWATETYKTDPLIIPVDLNKKITYRGFKFYDMEIIGSRGDRYELKKAYKRGDIKFIEKELGDTYIELVKMRKLLRPILEDIGYNDLLWW